ncbi:VanW family protein [Stomatohabitans albus]|uniref:VanW family protein n=1 Tax=Stomatohabitans albus TaxID=3110766 RepID=UPI00300C166B
MRTESRRLLITTTLSTMVLGGIGLGTYFAVKNPAPGTTIAGHPLSKPEDATEVAAEVAHEIHSKPVKIEVNGQEQLATVQSLGIHVDEALLVTIAQQHTGLSAWVDALTSGSATVELETYRTGEMETVQRIADELTKEPVNGNVTISGAEVRTFAAEKGSIVTPDAITTALEEALNDQARTNPSAWPEELVITPEVREQEPAITQQIVDQTAQALNGLIGTPFTVTNPKTNAVVELEAEDLSGLLVVHADPEAGDPTKRLRIEQVEQLPPPPSKLTTFLGKAVLPEGASARVVDRSPAPQKGSNEAQLTDVASITGNVVYEPGPQGVLPNNEATWNGVASALARGEHTAPIAVSESSVQDLRALGITQPVSTFTTFFTEGQQRNTNIKRIAELVNGTIIAPSESYELNHAVGPRTAAKGFVEGGAILEGELISSVGGGVSQFATTFFNAMWFAGVKINTFKPHTYHFDRYPWGREATIDYPGVNLELTNNTPYSILVEATTTANSVTVTFWSTPYFKVDQSIGQPYPVRGGTNVKISRTVTAPDGQTDQTDVTVHYRTQKDA